MSRFPRILLIVATVLVLAFALLIIIGLIFARLQTPKGSEIPLGVEGGRFVPCPDSPNCVSSMAEDDEHHVAPLSYAVSRDEALAAAQQALGSLSRTRIIEIRDDYIRAESRSALFRFVDDLEIYLPAAEDLLHFRSASRVGKSDMGANRKRYEAFAAAFRKELAD